MMVRSSTKWIAALVAALGWLAAAPAGAISISLSPATAAPSPGDVFAVDLVVAGLGNGAAPSLSLFDVTLGFDAGALALSSVDFGDFLGAIPADATADWVAGAGTLELAEYSILAPATLDALQPGSFRLATITFTATGAAPSSIAITASLLGDGFGNRLALDTPPGGTNVTPVPDPSAALLFAVGVVLVARAGGRRARAAG